MGLASVFHIFVSTAFNLLLLLFFGKLSHFLIASNPAPLVDWCDLIQVVPIHHEHGIVQVIGASPAASANHIFFISIGY